MTLNEAAERLGLSVSTLRNQARSGALRTSWTGPVRTVTEAEVERYKRESLGKPGRKK
jgi:excisionase family DNA binding protein